MGAPCIDCGAPTSGRGKTGRCAACALTAANRDPAVMSRRAAAAAASNRLRRKPRPRCACGTELTMRAKRCRPCNMAEVIHTPEVKARSSRTLAMRFRSDPAFRDRHRASVQAAVDERMKDPAFVAARAEAGRRNGPINITKTRGIASRAKAALAISNTRLAHIPVEQRALYRALVRGGTRAAEAEQIVREHARVEQARAVARVRQLDAAAQVKIEQRAQEASL